MTRLGYYVERSPLFTLEPSGFFMRCEKLFLRFVVWLAPPIISQAKGFL
jgi:hypothetical protein